MTNLLPAKRSSSFLIVFLFILCTLAVNGCIYAGVGIVAVDVVGGIGSHIVDSLDSDNIRDYVPKDYGKMDYDRNLPQGEELLSYYDPNDFYKMGYERHLRQGEELLLYSQFYGRCYGTRSNDRRLAITNERVLYWVADDVISLSVQSWITPISVDYIDIKKLEWLEHILRLHLYGVLEGVDLYCAFTSDAQKDEITQTIQTQVDSINMIRSDFGISIPEIVTNSELIKINEPVITELKARRQIK